MNPLKNPFSPGAGTPPPALVGRKPILDQVRIALARIKDGRSEKSLLLVGLRGVGKTVLLRSISNEATKLDCQHIFIETPEDGNLSSLLIPPLREILLNLDRMEGLNSSVKRALRVFRSFLGTIKLGSEMFNISIDVDPEPGVADSGDLQIDLPTLFTAIAEAAAARKTAIALIIDEMQYLSEKEFAALITAIHLVGQKNLPLLLIGAGLPQLVGLAGKAKSYAERLFSYPKIGRLSDEEAKEALCHPVQEQGVEYEDKAIEEIIKLTQGYPYFLQEWGYETWNFSEKSPISLNDIQNITPRVIKKLDENFFKVRFDRLTPNEKRYLRAMAELGDGPHRSSDITNFLKIKVQAGAPIRSTLIEKGMIYSPSYGDTAFTVPLFSDFMKRAIPNVQ
jgi:hypothetical protein